MPLFRKILLGICSNDAGKRKECDDIRECHQTVEDIRSIPNRFNREIRANENGCDIEPPENQCHANMSGNAQNSSSSREW